MTDAFGTGDLHLVGGRVLDPASALDLEGDVRLTGKCDAATCELGMHGVDVRHLQVERRHAMLLLIGGWHPHKQTHRAALEEAHLRWRREEQREAKRIAIERDRPVQILDRNEHLAHGRLGEIHA